MLRFRLAVFDLDGTLIDSRPDITTSINHTLSLRGLPPWSEGEVQAMIGEGARQLIERAIAGRLPPAAIDAVLADYAEYYERHKTERTRLYPGVREGLTSLTGIARAIATNKPGPLARAICDQLGLTSLVELILGEGDVPRRKPDPAMLDAAMARLGADRGDTLYIGDGAIDVHTARNASVPLCLVSWGYQRSEPLPSAPEFSAERFADVVEILKR